MKRRCPKCRRFDVVFYTTGNGRGYCKRCQQAYQRRHYRRNEQYYVDKARAANVVQQALLYSVIYSTKQVPCAECGRTYAPWIMQFDHIRDKDDCVSNLVRRGASLARLIAEICKCEVVCANCHAARTYLRLH